MSENCKPETEYVGVIAEADPVYVDDLFAAVKDMASALAGVIGTRTELVSEKFVSFARVTLTLQVPLALISRRYWYWFHKSKFPTSLVQDLLLVID